MCSFQCLRHTSSSFSRKVASLPKIASFQWYLTEELNLLSLLDRNVNLTIKFALMKVSENVEEYEPLVQTRVNMTYKKQNTC